MGAQGADILLSEKAYQLIPYDIECKNLKQIAVYKYYEQAQEHGDHTPLVIIKQNNSVPLAIVNLDTFIELIKIKNDYIKHSIK